jgi:thiamine-phosphate diphosphorylase
MADRWLHVLTSDSVVARDDFLERASEIIATLGPAGVFHLRTRRLGGARYVAVAQRLLDLSRTAGVALIINARVDVALAAAADGIQLGRGALTSSEVRRIAPHLLLGASVHSPQEAAEVRDADWVLLGNVFETTSHPGERGKGLISLRDAVLRSSLPLVAVGGITPLQVPAVLQTGAAGVAVLSGVWAEGTPNRSLLRYLSAYDQHSSR